MLPALPAPAEDARHDEMISAADAPAANAPEPAATPSDRSRSAEKPTAAPAECSETSDARKAPSERGQEAGTRDGAWEDATPPTGSRSGTLAPTPAVIASAPASDLSAPPMTRQEGAAYPAALAPFRIRLQDTSAELVDHAQLASAGARATDEEAEPHPAEITLEARSDQPGSPRASGPSIAQYTLYADATAPRGIESCGGERDEGKRHRSEEQPGQGPAGGGCEARPAGRSDARLGQEDDVAERGSRADDGNRGEQDEAAAVSEDDQRPTHRRRLASDPRSASTSVIATIPVTTDLRTFHPDEPGSRSCQPGSSYSSPSPSPSIAAPGSIAPPTRPEHRSLYQAPFGPPPQHASQHTEPAQSTFSTRMHQQWLRFDMSRAYDAFQHVPTRPQQPDPLYQQQLQYPRALSSTQEDAAGGAGPAAWHGGGAGPQYLGNAEGAFGRQQPYAPYPDYTFSPYGGYPAQSYGGPHGDYASSAPPARGGASTPDGGGSSSTSPSTSATTGQGWIDSPATTTGGPGGPGMSSPIEERKAIPVRRQQAEQQQTLPLYGSGQTTSLDTAPLQAASLSRVPPQEVTAPALPQQGQAVPAKRTGGRRTAPRNSYPIDTLPGVKPFISKLRWLVSNPQEVGDVVTWTAEGDMILVKTGGEGATMREVLLRTFAHENVGAFSRQFINYGFTAVRDPNILINLLSPLEKAEEWRGFVDERGIFERDNVHDLEELKALAPKPKESTKTGDQQTSQRIKTTTATSSAPVPGPSTVVATTAPDQLPVPASFAPSVAQSQPAQAFSALAPGPAPAPAAPGCSRAASSASSSAAPVEGPGAPDVLAGVRNPISRMSGTGQPIAGLFRPAGQAAGGGGTEQGEEDGRPE
ncbi:hypothetical protein JCM8202v2_005898 [Rhodotorula sphaerocarpa]